MLHDENTHKRRKKKILSLVHMYLLSHIVKFSIAFSITGTWAFIEISSLLFQSF